MKLFDIHRDETAPVAWSALWFSLVLASYYVIRPVRETFAANLTGAEKATLFTATLVVMLLVTPLYGLIVSRTSRRWLVPLVYGFFTANLLLFAALSRSPTPPSEMQWLGKVFFVWVSVFNLFVVTLFWGSVVDLFTAEQGKRLFGIIAAAGTIGQIASSWFVKLAVEQLGTGGLLIASALILVTAIICSFQLRRFQSHSNSVPSSEQFRWSAAWEGALAVVRTPLLLGVALFIIGSSICATLAYFQMTEMVGRQIADEQDRSAWFAQLNEWTGYVTLLLQSAVVSWLLRRLGVATTLSLAPLVLLIGFTTLYFLPTLAVVFYFQVALRGSAFGFANPSLETLYTRVTPEEKYRAKAFIDTVGKRTGDVAGGQLFQVLTVLGLSATLISLAALPLAFGALVVAIFLGARKR
ncbi:NTP/NDP exchange transporter [Adhaeretor mobilis]|uniref:TLC ATP/ADP transporter n=1 Tax=Adhaeretor mobilis TaxID=1930276 RepID=A0A517MX00_9BACT|nr:MFS transporter [Adhaeretor mobilis]QDS99402.1 TLC ATP/ADP transporter [Adhaeretor mobilis]